MELKRVCLVLADISGYTRFMKLHTTSLIHAEVIVTELLEMVISQAESPLTLSKLEGDAVFLYAPLEGDETAIARDVTKQITAFFEVFQAKERDLIACDTCQCDACSNIAQLKLKVILHCGEVAFKTIRQFEELAGEPVIVIHRLLKNSIPTKEYILMTEAFYDLSGGLADRTPETRVEEAEGIGPVTVKAYYPPAEMSLPPRSEPAPPRPGTALWDLTLRFNGYAVRRMLGREARPQFAHLPDEKLTPFNLLNYFIGGIGGNIVAGLRYQRSKKK